MDNFLFARLRSHWLPILLGFGGLLFLGYGLITLIAPKSDKSDILFEAASDTSSLVKESPAPEKKITVDVEGAVEKPGVYDLAQDARVQDALIAAGGMSKTADRQKVSQGLNLAAKLTDGGKIYIPVVGEAALASSGTNMNSGVLGADSSAININNASASELDKLQGVGPVTAEKIITARPYATIDELVSKKVVSQKVFDQIKGKITIY